MIGALFDLDGVLVDTESIYSRFWGEQGRRHNVGVDNFSDVIKGTTLHQILNNYFDVSEHDSIVAELLEFENQMPYVLFEGVIPLLEGLKSEGIAMAIVTSSGDKKLEAVFEQNRGFRDYFDAIVTDAKVTRSKPDPQGYLLAAAELSAVPEQCCVFEDSYNGLLAGRRSGAAVIALATTNPAQTLIDKADLVVESMTELSARRVRDVIARHA